MRPDYQPIPPVLTIAGLREVEVSITEHCTLRCADCGFLVPSQPKPSVGDPVDEIGAALAHLARMEILVDSLAIVGGEPTLASATLERLAVVAKASGAIGRVEVVTNGLTPQGLSADTLAKIDRLSLSNYGYSQEFVAMWRNWLAKQAPQVEFVVRNNAGGWDPWAESAPRGAADAQRFWDTCWYRRHCVTLERGRLFACSRVPKFARDGEGLLLTKSTTRSDIEQYLNGVAPLPSCATCTPMMGMPTVAPGRQPDDRIQRLERKAMNWLRFARDIAERQVQGELQTTGTVAEALTP